MSGLPTISYFLAPFLQSLACGAVLYGTAVLQGYYYLINCDDEPLWTKIFVAFIFVVETACTALSFCALHAYTIKVMENPLNILKLDWTICATPILINVVQILVTSYYIGRMWSYTRSKLLTTLAFSLVVTRAVSFAYAQHHICKAGTWITIRQDPQSRVAAIIAMASGPLADAITAISVAIPLYRCLPKVRRMRQVITWILVMTVNTGFVLVAVGLCTLITFLKMTESITWAGALLLSGKLYANSLFAMLNGRLALRSRLNHVVVDADDIMLPNRGHILNEPVHVNISEDVYYSDVVVIGHEVKDDKSNEGSSRNIA